MSFKPGNESWINILTKRKHPFLRLFSLSIPVGQLAGPLHIIFNFVFVHPIYMGKNYKFKITFSRVFNSSAVPVSL
mgnify:CR=1 FL=1